MEVQTDPRSQWFVMRDLKRPNAKYRAYQQLTDAGFQVFTPMTTKVIESSGKRQRVQVPFVPDLLFVKSAKESLDPLVAKTETLQYRFVKGAAYRTPMTVPDYDMDRFITAVRGVKAPQFYTPEEITPNMYGAKVRIVCEGLINGLEGTLLKIKGSGKKRFLVELPGILAASIEIASSDYIELLTP